MKPALILKKTFARYLYRHKPIGLSAGKLYLYLDALYRSKNVPGDVVEIGCNICGTSALARQMLRKMGSDRGYYCIDTFGGFVEDQFQRDTVNGTPSSRRKMFSDNDIGLARRVLKLHRSEDVKLIQADIVTLPVDSLPPSVSVCLLDVDLYEPIYQALNKIYPRMSNGGTILVDDCGGDIWKAGDAFRKFTTEMNIKNSRLEFGMGIINIEKE